MKPAESGVIIAKLIAAGMLFVALGRHPYDYYTILRWIACGVAAFTAYQAFEIKRIGWIFVFAVVALLFNPLVPLHLRRGTWECLNLAAAALLLLSIPLMDVRKAQP